MSNDKETDRYVAFIDIMGFKDLVARRAAKEIYSMMLSISKTRQVFSDVSWGEGKRFKDYVSMIGFSDSIVFSSKDDTEESLSVFIGGVSLLSYDLLSNGIPHKGAVSFGRMTWDDDNSIYFGQPLIDAFYLQEELGFYGIAVHHTAEESFMRFKDNGDVIALIGNHKCRFKKGCANHPVLYPLLAEAPDQATFEAKNEEFFQGIGKLTLQTSGALRQYIDNTKEYINDITQFFLKPTD